MNFFWEQKYYPSRIRSGYHVIFAHIEFLMYSWYFNSRQIKFPKRLRFLKIIAAAMVDSDFPQGGEVFLVLLIFLS